MRFAELVATSAKTAKTRKRTEKRDLLAALFGRLSGPERAIGVAYLAGTLPQGKIGVGYAAIRDLPAAPEPEESTLTLAEVDAALTAIGAIAGKGSKQKRADALGALFAQLRQDERRFLGALIVGELRQGALVSSMLDAAAQHAKVPAKRVRRAAMLAGDPALVAGAVLDEGEAALARFRLTVFRPVLPMLASPCAGPEAAFERHAQLRAELKLDGARVQVHKQGDEVRVYTRKLHDVTSRVPEIVEEVRALEADSLILDGETIALRPDGRPHPFQTTMKRFGRSKDVAAMRKKLPLRHFYFDLLLRDGDSWLERPLAERAAALQALLPEANRVPAREVGDADALEDFYAEATEAGHEGVMAKALDAPYAAGSRGFAWLKIKPTHELDLVVLAVERGSGRRKGWLSNLHLGARDPETGGFVMLGKTFKGLSDEMLAWQTKHLGELALPVDDDAEDARWVVRVRPTLVVEIAFSNVQASPQYPAGMALRFARVRRHRPDKDAKDAATIDEVRAIFERE